MPQGPGSERGRKIGRKRAGVKEDAREERREGDAVGLGCVKQAP